MAVLYFSFIIFVVYLKFRPFVCLYFTAKEFIMQTVGIHGEVMIKNFSLIPPSNMEKNLGS